MAAEGAIAIKEKILYVFSSLHFTIPFLWRSFQNCASWQVDGEQSRRNMVWFNWYFEIKLGTYIIMGDIRLK